MANEGLNKKLKDITGVERKRRLTNKIFTDSEEFGVDDIKERNFLVSLGDSATYNNPYTGDFIEKEILMEVYNELLNNPDKDFDPLKIANDLIAKNKQTFKEPAMNSLKAKNSSVMTMVIYPTESTAKKMQSLNPNVIKQGYKEFINYKKEVVRILRDPEFSFTYVKSAVQTQTFKGSFPVTEWNTHMQPGELGHAHVDIFGRMIDPATGKMSIDVQFGTSNLVKAIGKELNARLKNSVTLTAEQISDLEKTPFSILTEKESYTNSVNSAPVQTLSKSINEVLKPEQENNFLNEPVSDDNNENDDSEDEIVYSEDDYISDKLDKISKTQQHIAEAVNNDDLTDNITNSLIEGLGVNLESVKDENPENDSDFIPSNDSQTASRDVSHSIDLQIRDHINQIKTLSKMKTLSQANTLLQEQVTELHKIALNERKEKRELDQQVIVKDSEIDKLNNHVESLNGHIDNLKINDQGNRTTIDELVNNIRSFENEIDLRDKKLLENNGKIEDLKGEISVLTQDKTDLEEENKELEKEVSSLKTNNIALTGEVKKLTESIDELTTANTSLTKQKEMLERQVKTAKEDRDTYKANAEKAETDRTAAITEKNKAITDLSNAQTEHTTEINKIKRENAEALSTLESGKNAEIDELKKQIRELQNKALDTQTEHKKATSQLEEKHQEELKKEKANSQSFKDDLSVVMKVFFEKAPELMSKEQFQEILKQTKNLDASKMADHFYKDDNGFKPKNS